MTIQQTPVRRIIRARELCERVGKSRTQVWRDVRAGKFPAPVQLGPNAVGWFLDEVIAWQEALPRVTYHKAALNEAIS